MERRENTTQSTDPNPREKYRTAPLHIGHLPDLFQGIPREAALLQCIRGGGGAYGTSVLAKLGEALVVLFPLHRSHLEKFWESSEFGNEERQQGSTLSYVSPCFFVVL